MKLMIRHSKPTLSTSDSGLFKKVLEASYPASGAVTRDFENKFAGYTGCAGAVATNSGTSALHLALLALGVGKGDEVIIPSYVCASLLDAVNYTGARPVLADIDHNTFNINPESARSRLTDKTKAVIIAHMFGLPCDIGEFLRLGVPVIEDCAQSLGARYNGKMTGSFGAVSIFSFYATKLITTGYGGMAASNSKKLLDKIRDLSEPDKRESYKVRYNYKMSDLEAALGIDQLKKIGMFIKKRKDIARRYAAALSSCDLSLPAGTRGRDHIFYRYVIKTKNADLIGKRLRKNGIEVIAPVHKPAHRYLSKDRKNFPNTEKVYREAVSLPVYPALRPRELSFVIKALRKAIAI